MDFSESPKVASIRTLIRDFMDKEIYPLEQELLHDGFRAMLPVLAEKRARARQTANPPVAP